jgi:phosphoribosylanthranilate isomerase
LVKICGVTRLEDAERAAALGAYAIGFIFWPNSPRIVVPGHAARIARSLPASLLRVGVFVDQSPADVARIVGEVGLDVVQLHGDERVADYAAVGARVFKSVRLESEADVRAAAALDATATPLVDAVDREKRGGTGRTPDWRLAADLARVRAIILAGGLTPENVTTAIATVRPWAIDVSSGVETSPGVKSAGRLSQLFAAVNELDRLATARTDE